MIAEAFQNWLPWLIGAAALAAVIVATLLLRRRSDPQPDAAAYMRNLHLLGATERSFLRVLEPAAGDRYRVFAKVRVAQLVAPRAGVPANRSREAMELIRDWYFDFVVCERDSLTVVCAIDLDDRPAPLGRRRRGDSPIGGLCAAIGLPYARIAVQSAYSLDEIRASLNEALGISPASAEAGIRADRRRVAPASTEPPIYAIDPVGPETAPRCPKCGSQTTRRKTRGGDYPAREFWGCIRFPECRGMVPLRGEGVAPR